MPSFLILWLLRIVTSTVKNLPNDRIEINLNIIPLIIKKRPMYGINKFLLIGNRIKMADNIPREFAIPIVIQIILIVPLSKFFLSSLPE
jgi:hypothetical protein